MKNPIIIDLMEKTAINQFGKPIEELSYKELSRTGKLVKKALEIYKMREGSSTRDFRLVGSF